MPIQRAAADKYKSDKPDTAFTPPTPDPALPKIGPEGQGNILVAWDPIAGKERWRGLAAGQTQGGTLSAGNLVFVSLDKRLVAYRADNGDKLLDITTGLSTMSSADDFHDRWQAVRRGSGRSRECAAAFLR